jgi:hypothetical protein
MGKYFDKLPIISYNGVMVRDITRAVKVPEVITGDPHTFYPYSLQQRQRADTIASAYYDDPYAVWLVYLSNGIIDPYFDWYVSDTSFVQHIIDKYGSVQVANRTIEYYRVNWYDDDTHLSSDSYAILSDNVKKYYSPVVSDSGMIIYYERKKSDLTVATSIVYAFTFIDDNTLNTGDLVTITVGSVSGTGEVMYADADLLYIKNVVITTPIIDQTGTITSDLSATPQTVTFIGADVLTSSIPDDEQVFWSPVSSWDLELERNTTNSTIRLLDKAFSIQADQALSTAFGA